MLRGTIKFFNETKGFGYITPDEADGDVFLHISCVAESQIERIYQGDRVEFLTVSKGGRISASKISLLSRGVLNKKNSEAHVENDVAEYNSKRTVAVSSVPLPSTAVGYQNMEASPLVAKARARIQSQANDSHTLQAWDRVLQFINNGTDRRIYSQDSYGGSWGSRQPAFNGDWGKLSAWCKLVGLKPQWHDPKAGVGIGSAWTWSWYIYVESTTLPNERLRHKLIAEYGRPPGY